MLLVVMLVLAILTERGSIALDATVADLSQASTYKRAEQAFYYSEAGIGEAKGRLMGSPAINPNFVRDPAATPNPLWSAYIITSSSWTTAQDPDYKATYTNYFPKPGSLTNTTKVVNSLQTTIPYWIKIRHKREYDAELEGHTPATPHYTDADGSTAPHTAAAPGNIIYYGYYPMTTSVPTEFTTATATVFEPVELVRAYGASGASSKSIEVDLVRNVSLSIEASMYTKGNITFISTTSVSGNDDCGGASAKPPVFIKNPSVISGSPLYLGSPPAPQNGTLDLDILSLINSLRAGATVLTTDQAEVNFGSSSNYVTVYSDTSNPVNLNGLKLDRGTSYGILLVEGDLELRRNTWNGIVLVTGGLTYSTTPTEPMAVKGAVFANHTSGTQTVDKDGDAVIKYDSCHVAKALAGKPLEVKLQVKRWRERS